MNKITLFEQFYGVARQNYKSDKQLSEAIGISRGAFSHYTRKNNPRSPNASTLEKWCAILGIKIVDNVFKKM